MSNFDTGRQIWPLKKKLFEQELIMKIRNLDIEKPPSAALLILTYLTLTF